MFSFSECDSCAIIPCKFSDIKAMCAVVKPTVQLSKFRLLTDLRNG